MGIMIGSAVIPLWNLMTWDKASGTGAIVAAWSGLVLALITWFIAAAGQSGTVNVASLGTNEVMLSGNVVAICSSGIIHYVWSKFIDKSPPFDFSTLNSKITLVEQDMSGLGEEQQDPVELARSKRWITRRGWGLTIVLVIIWPLLSVPAQVFSVDYFAFWVLVAIVWGFGSACVITVLPLVESSEEIGKVITGIMNLILCKSPEEGVWASSGQTAEKNVEIEMPVADKPIEEKS
jgi:hypothetical protein